MTDGPYVEGKEHIGGLTIIKAANLDKALEGKRLLVPSVLTRHRIAFAMVREAQPAGARWC